MRRKASDKRKIIWAFGVLLTISIISDITQTNTITNGVINRAEIGGKKEDVTLRLEMDGTERDYVIEVSPTQPTREEAEKYFDTAIMEIDKDMEGIREIFPQKEEYLNGIVKAKWNLSPRGYVDASGKIRYEEIDEEGDIIQVNVILSCGRYERQYSFPWTVLPQEISQQEKNMQQLQALLEEQMAKEGSSQIELPVNLGGKELKWSQKKEYITPKILILEIIAVILLWLSLKEKKKRDEQKKLERMEKEYPDIVNQLSFLLGAGMTIRQAWNRVSAQYEFKKRELGARENEVYEAILRMNRRFAEGESERLIYQQFLQEIPTSCYRRLMRMLLGSTEKGMLGICERLEDESRLAYEQRVVQAKKLGEEASAKMLLPLMLMLVVVMGIVILPALIGFQL